MRARGHGWGFHSQAWLADVQKTTGLRDPLGAIGRLHYVSSPKGSRTLSSVAAAHAMYCGKAKPSAHTQTTTRARSQQFGSTIGAKRTRAADRITAHQPTTRAAATATGAASDGWRTGTGRQRAVSTRLHGARTATATDRSTRHPAVDLAAGATSRRRRPADPMVTDTAADDTLSTGAPLPAETGLIECLAIVRPTAGPEQAGSPARSLVGAKTVEAQFATVPFDGARGNVCKGIHDLFVGDVQLCQRHGNVGSVEVQQAHGRGEIGRHLGNHSVHIDACAARKVDRSQLAPGTGNQIAQLACGDEGPKTHVDVRPERRFVGDCAPLTAKTAGGVGQVQRRQEPDHVANDSGACQCSTNGHHPVDLDKWAAGPFRDLAYCAACAGKSVSQSVVCSRYATTKAAARRRGVPRERRMMLWWFAVVE